MPATGTIQHERGSSVITINNQLMNVNNQKELIQKFILACQNGDMATVKELVESKLVSPNDHLGDNVTALHWAAINNRLSICRYLISKHAKVDHQGGDLEATPLHWACRYGLVYIADFLIKNGADPELTDGQGFNSLQLAVHSSNIMLVLYMLLMTDVPVNSCDPSDRTPLHWAAYQGDALSVAALLKFGANVNKTDNTGFTAFHWSLIKANPLCLRSLIKNNSNIFATANDGKNAFDIAVDMDHSAILQQVLKECGRDSDGNKVRVPEIFIKNPKLPKVITFLVPYVVIGLTLEFFSDYYNIFQTIFFDTGVYFMAYFFLQKLIFPSYVHKKKFFKSPLFAGLFSSCAAWVIINWLLYVLPNTLDTNVFANILFSLSATSVVFCFFKAMFLNPGTILPLTLTTAESPEEDNLLANEKAKNNVKADIRKLIANGKFDSTNFCVHSYVRRPLRSKYSDFSKGLVARFDHYCPWVYNDIGLRNHKIFLFFVLSLESAILTFAYLAIQYFNYVSDYAAQFVYSYDGKLRTVKRPPHSPFQVYHPINENECSILTSSWCNGYSDSFPLFMLVSFCLFQAVWVLFLLFVQFYQISKNLTTYEALTLKGPDDNYYFSPVPIELVTEFENPNSSTFGIDSTAGDTVKESLTIDGTLGNSHEPPDIFNLRNFPPKFCITLLRLIGITQFVDTLKNKKRFRSSHFNFGMRLNCLEFWCLGNTSKSKTSIKNFFRIPSLDNGQTYIGDQLVDYYKLYDYPIRKVSYKELV